MTTSYYDLIYHSGLYGKDFIQAFGEDSTHWRGASDRNRELSLRHDMVCVLLCNLESNPIQSTIDSITRSFKRKYQGSVQSDEPPMKSTRLRSPEPSTSKGGTSHFHPPSLQSSSDQCPSTSGTSSSEDYEIHRDPEEGFRFWLIEGMPNPASIQLAASEKWGIEAPKSQWDLVDRKYRKFVEVKCMLDKERAQELYVDKSVGMGSYCSLFWICPRSLSFKWTDHPGDARGLSKVINFLATRRQIMINMGIQEGATIESSSMVETILCSSYLNNLVKEWSDDFWEHRNRAVDYDALYRRDEASLDVITANDLLEMLDNPTTRKGPFVTWKGKLTPCGLTKNYVTETNKDSSIICELLNVIEIENYQFDNFPINRSYEGNPTFNQDILQTIVEFIKMAHLSPDQPKDYIDETANDVLKALGVGAKNSIHNESDESTVQPEYSRPTPMRYHYWFEHVIRLLNSRSEDLGEQEIVMKNLLEKPVEYSHPLSKICEESCSEFLKEVLVTNSAVYSAKLTNVYSRLGGAYLDRAKKGESSLNTRRVAIFPIYATAYDISGNSTDKACHRLTSGIVIRGPNHARNMTDKINIITIEFLHKRPDVEEFCKFFNKAIVYRGLTSFLVIRQNAVRKADPTFLMFTQNSLFVPFNLVGELTLGNPNAPSNMNPSTEINAFVADNAKWLTERFTEGVLSAAIGNSNDEGYFAGLRKLFMVVLCWRRGVVASSINLEGFCESINECLIDNPLSMHFHDALLKIIKVYERSQQATYSFVHTD
uniref:PA n=1 Tax=Lestrade virus TaxID=2600332 RepID=A0A5B8XDH0_9ORTO|nr:PA [Lestrade virus]